MTVRKVPECSEIYYVDVPMFGMQQVNSPYIVDAQMPAIVDTGPEAGAPSLLEGLDAIGRSPDEIEYILPTHAHLDHAGGAGHLAECCENATVICHEKGVEYLTDERKLDTLAESVERAIGFQSPYGEPQVIDPSQSLAVVGGEQIDLGDRTLEIIDAPGHAPHQYCVYEQRNEVLFSGDANGMQFPDVGHRPTTPPPNFDLEAALETIERLQTFEPETILYPHFGPGEIGAGRRELEEYHELLPAYVDRVSALRQECGEDVSVIASEMTPEWGHWSLETDVAGILRYLDVQL